MKNLRQYILDQDPNYKEHESEVIFNSLDTMGRWRKYTMQHHDDLIDLVERFIGNHAEAPLDNAGKVIYLPNPMSIFFFEAINGEQFKGGFWANGAVVAMMGHDKNTVELYIDNDSAKVHGYPDSKYYLNGRFYGD